MYFKDRNNGPVNQRITVRAVSLVELLAVLTVISILVGVAAYPLLGIIEAARMRAEREIMSRLADEVRASFRNDDMSLNVSALPGEIYVDTSTLADKAGVVTQFDYRDSVYSPATDNVSATAWYAKLAKLRGQLNLSGGLVANTSGELHAISHNIYQRRRFILVGPAFENEYQRYVMISIMTGQGQSLSIPAPGGSYGTTDYKTWFDNIYNHGWGADENPPAGWTDPVWSKSHGRGTTYAQRVIVERIAQPRYMITLNNSGDEDIFIRTNLEKETALDASGLVAKYEASAHTPSTKFPAEGLTAGGINVGWPTGHTALGILSGRRIVIHARATDATGLGTKIFSFLLNEETTITIQL